MPQYLHPGVYIEEIERGPRPIEGVPTSIPAFLGETERGPVTPRMVTSYRGYQRWFGDVFDPAARSALAVSSARREFDKRLLTANAQPRRPPWSAMFGAGDRDRTDDIQLGKLTFYH